MKQLLLYIILSISIIFSQENESEKYHISLIIHENLINDFFSSMGEITGSGETSFASYNWKLIKPHVEIEEDSIYLLSEIIINVGEMKTRKDIKGYISAEFDEELNEINLVIEEAEVIIDVDVFGSNHVIKKLDIADYFPEKFSLNGPNVLAEYVEFKLPSGDVRQVNISLNNSFLKLTKDAIKVYTSLNFNSEK